MGQSLFVPITFRVQELQQTSLHPSRAYLIDVGTTQLLFRCRRDLGNFGPGKKRFEDRLDLSRIPQVAHQCRAETSVGLSHDYRAIERRSCSRH